MKKNFSILGVTGSIGKSALKVYDNFINDLNLIAVSANNNLDNLLQIIEKYNPEYAVLHNSELFKKNFNAHEIRYKNTMIYSGIRAGNKIYEDTGNDIIVNGISGKAGLLPSIKILDNGIDLALANKESIVCAGPILKEIADKNNAKIIPIDSEHSALFHLMHDRNIKYIDKIYLTASGGPFLNLQKKEWHTITVKDALNHPTWKMGNKISIDSATMANKGLEVIEAHFLFGLDYENIKVLIHPQSLIHSMIETLDCEIYAQIGPNDMSIPIQNALFYPEIKCNTYNKLDFSKSYNFEIMPVDMDKFKMLKIAYECGIKGGLYPAFFNYVNEILVNLFLSEKISFLQIENFMSESLNTFSSYKGLSDKELSLENLYECEIKAVEIINKFI